eukprot:Ihof_evm23s12 gene=Ihof_evmTU23s12
MTNLLTWSLVAVATLVSTTVAVERANFKTCAQAGFCSRNRLKAGEERLPQYAVDPLSVEVLPTKVTAVLMDQSTNFKLAFEVIGVESGTARMRIFETNPLKPRYEVPEVVLPYTEFGFEEITKSSASLLVQLKGTDHRVNIQFNPFTVEFLAGDDVLVTANSRNLMKFEYLKPRPEEVPMPESNEDGSYNDTEAYNRWSQYNEEMEAFNGESFKNFPDSKPLGYTSVAMDFRFEGFNHVYGIPSHADTLALKNTQETDPYRLYNLDVFEFELYNPMALYGSIPVMLAHSARRTVSLFWLNASETWIEILDALKNGVASGKDTHWISESGIMDVFIMFGPTPKDVATQYSKLTGTTSLPPKFSMGYHQCRWNYNNVQDVLSVDSKFDEHNIPYDVIWLDIEHTDDKRYFTWHPTNFEESLHMLETIGNKSRKMVNIIDPHIKRDGNYHVHQEATQKDFYIHNKDGGEYDGWCWPGSSSWLDFTREDVRDFWGDMLSLDSYKNTASNLHVWNDMNEPSVFNGPEITMHKDAIHAGGYEHRDVHNIYGMLVHRATAEGLIKRSGNRERPFVLSRAFFAGTQRYGAIWTGDNKASWDHLRVSPQMLLSMSVSGMPFVGVDVGGFFGNPDAQLMTRWYQAGIFYPFFRAHAHLDTNRREPWMFTPEDMKRFATAIKVRYAMLPIWYTAFYQSHLTGSPVIRPLWWEYSNDTTTFGMDDGYLIGQDILVNPVYEADAVTKEVYFPGKRWYNLFTEDRVVGPTTLTLNVDQDTMVAYQRGGSILPFQYRPRRSSACMTNDPYTLKVALNAKNEASGELFMDDGSTFDYQKGQYSYRQYTYQDGVLTSTSLSADGTMMPNNRLERLVIMGLSTTPTT